MANLKLIEEEISGLTTEMLSPPRSPAAALFGDEIDNVAWVDFIETRYALEQPKPPGPSPFASEPNAEELANILATDEAGIDTRDYEAFYRMLRDRVFKGLWQYYSMWASLFLAEFEIAYDVNNGTITFPKGSF